MRTNKILSILLIFTLAISIIGCSRSTADNNASEKSNSTKTQLVYASTKDIRNINPHLYSGEMAAQNMIFESLVINTADGVKPWLAESWTLSDDGKVYTFKLRQDVKFTDGEAFNAEAAKLNIDAVMNNAERHSWLELVNQIDHVTIADDFTIELVLKNPYYPTLAELGLTRPFRFISPNCFIDGNTKDGVSGYVGTGPWVLSEHKENEYAIFEANDTYWGEKTKLQTIKWQVMPDHQTILLALQKGEIDLLFGADGDMIDLDSFKALEQKGQYTTVMSEPIASRAILLNSKKSITGDLQVRNALQYAIDKEAIAEGILNGSESVANTLLSPTTPYCDVKLEEKSYDVEKASQLLDAAGWIMGNDGYRYKNGSKFEIIIYYNSNNSQERTISEFIQDNLKKVGVSLKIVGEEKQAFLDRQKSGDFDLQYSLSWGVPYDPQSYLSSWRIPAHGDYQAQAGLEKKAWLDDRIGEVMIETDENRRQEMYREILTYIHEASVYIPLTYSRTKAVHVPGLKGVGFNISQYEIPFEKMYFEE
ncbi:nickel ABC transporter substrate-binding protein [Geosporobacter ferrireducens]|uniref:Nickel ABC transporter, nickel/metallophore periplasmic binding protein n=1 Tax=Geosporobacter ferrireducens TaxID=1424294 RepID=A0A1D8GL41_9FIRM|nr:nickel ABC transporter substrate-binding protein [Geosporobacter ferrireducens]AOT71623.1 nickel ABC transporter, nickel/metallophore periplasmic binding protein [Geosporobacter ferrireducens]